MGPHQRRWSIVAIAASSVALAACGGSSSTSSSTAASSTPSSSPPSSATASSTATSAPSSTAAAASGSVPPAFAAALNQIQGPYKQMARAIQAELQAAGSQSDAAVAASTTGLARTAAAIYAQLSHLQVPAAVQAEFGHLRDGTKAIAGDLQRIQAAAASHNAAAAHAAANDLASAFAQVASGINGLKQKGLK